MIRLIFRLSGVLIVGHILASYASQAEVMSLDTRLLELAIEPVRQFYVFIETHTDEWTLRDYRRQAPKVMDQRGASCTTEEYFQWIYYARLIRDVFLPSSRNRCDVGSVLEEWDILYGLQGGNPSNNGPFDWSIQPFVILQSPVLIRGDGDQLMKGIKQVAFRLFYDKEREGYFLGGSIYVNGIHVIGDSLDKYWALKPNFWTKDLWRRLGIRAPRPSNDYLFLDREASQMAAERDLGYATWISSKRTDTQGVKSGSIAVGDDELRAALDLIYEFYDHLLKGSPPEKCPSIFAVQFGEINQLSEDDNVRVWRLFQEMREALDITRFSLTREKREMEWLKESVRQFSLIVRHYYPRRPMHSRDFFYVVYRRNAFKDEGEFFVSDPFMVQEIWVPVARFEDGFRIVYNEVMVNGIPIYQLGFTELPPAIELWKALGFPMDPDKVRRARVMLTRFRMEAEDRANGPWR